MNFKRMVSAFCNGKDLINTYKMDPRANMAPRDVKVLILSLTEGETHHRLVSHHEPTQQLQARNIFCKIGSRDGTVTTRGGLHMHPISPGVVLSGIFINCFLNRDHKTPLGYAGQPSLARDLTGPVMFKSYFYFCVCTAVHCC